MLAAGTKVGRYVIEGESSRDRPREVYLAVDSALGRRAEIELFSTKPLHADGGPSYEAALRAASLLRHDRIADVYDWGTVGAQLFIATEYVPGRTLAEWLKQTALPPVAKSLRLIEDLCAGIAYAHGAGVCHGDISPVTLIVDESDRLRIRGFGVAQLRRGAAAQPELLEALGYQAPELLAGGVPDERSDVFSIAAICFELRQGRKPFAGATVAEIAFRTLSDDPFPGRPYLESLDELLDLGLRKHPDDRLDVAGFGEVVASIRAHEEAPSVPPAPRGFIAGGSIPLPPPRPFAQATGSAQLPTEQVQFTVYRPKAVRPAEWRRLLAFMHLADRPPGAPPDAPSPLEQVRTLVEQTLGPEADDFGTVTADARRRVPRENEITLIPTVPGIEFNPDRRVFRWVQDVHLETFLLRARPETDGQTAAGSLTVYSGVFLLANIDISIRVDSRLEAHRGPVALSSTASFYRKIFASYSRADDEIVRQFERLAESLGDMYLKDVRALRAGEVWSARLLDLIDEADVFQLFWSTTAMKSPHVRREWEHALSLGRPAFVRPTYWEEPMPTSVEEDLPPDALRRLHFHRLSVAVEVQEPTLSPAPQVVESDEAARRATAIEEAMAERRRQEEEAERRRAQEAERARYEEARMRREEEARRQRESEQWASRRDAEIKERLATAEAALADGRFDEAIATVDHVLSLRAAEREAARELRAAIEAKLAERERQAQAQVEAERRAAEGRAQERRAQEEEVERRRAEQARLLVEEARRREETAHLEPVPDVLVVRRPPVLADAPEPSRTPGWLSGLGRVAVVLLGLGLVTALLLRAC